MTKKTPGFSVKRKQINFNLLDNSSSGSFHHHHHSVSSTTSINQDIFDHLLKEKDEAINELKKQLKQTNQELQTTRHQHSLMANEQSQFEANIIEKCSKEKASVELELKILKETHVEKIQSLATSLNQLAGTVASLRNQLKLHQIKEEINEDNNSLLLVESSLYKKDAQFIQDAYFNVKQETHVVHPLWSNIQYTTACIKHEIDDFEAWKSIPVADLAKLLREDQQKNNSVKSLLFGRYKK
ncbi:hypothetical protein BD770DRAFT_376754, partial [Pilaira anomala]